MKLITDDFEVRTHKAGFWRRYRWWLAVAILPPLVIFIVCCIGLVRSQNEVARLTAAIQARAEPTNVSELEAYYRAPPRDRDATLLWLGAAKSLQDAERAKPHFLPSVFFESSYRPPAPGSPWPDLEHARRFLDQNHAAMQQLHDAAALGGAARYPLTFKSGWVILDDLAALRRAAYWFEFEANVRARDGDYHGATESIRAGLLLSQSLEYEPITATQLVRMSVVRRLMRLLEQIEINKLSATDLTKLQDALAQNDFAVTMRRAIIGERALGLIVFDNESVLDISQQEYHRVLTRVSDRTMWLTTMTEAVAASEAPWIELNGVMDAWHDDFEARVRPIHSLTRYITPAINNISEWFAKGETFNRLAIIYIAIARYRLEHGHPPERLAELAPDFVSEVPIDPTTGEAFHYHVTAGGFLLYSPSTLFSKAQDEQLDSETGAHPDVVFRWPPLPDEPKRADAEEPAEDDPAGMNEDGEAAPADAEPHDVARPQSESTLRQGER